MSISCNLSGQRIMVLGAGGFLGSAATTELRRAGAYVIGSDMHPARHGIEADEWHLADVFTDRLHPELFAGVDTIIHLAWRNIPATANADMGADAMTNVAGSARLFAQAARLGVRRIIYASSGGTVYGRARSPTNEEEPIRPLNGYGAGKAAAEHYLTAVHHAFGIQACTLRIANPYGPGQLPNRGQGFIATAVARTLAGEPVDIFGSASIRRDYIYIDDVIRALVLACADREPLRIWNIGSGIAVSLDEILPMIMGATGQEPIVRYTEGRSVDNPHVQLDVSRIRRDLGWEPSTCLSDGIGLTIDWLRENARQAATPRQID